MFESRREARKHRRERGLNGSIVRGNDGNYSIDDTENNLTYFKNTSDVEFSNQNENGVVTSALVTANATKGGGNFVGDNWKDIAFMANDLTQAYIGGSTTLRASTGYRSATTTVQLPLGLATRTSTRALSVISKVGGGLAKAVPWVAGGALVVDVVSNKQITAGNVYQGVVTGISLIPRAGLIVGGGALALEGVSYYYTGKSVSDNINQSLNGGVVHSWK